MTTRLDSRVIRIIRWLLDQSEPRPTADLASDLGLSQRVVRYRLNAVERALGQHQLTLEKQRGVGLWIGGSPDARADVASEIFGLDEAPRLFSAQERKHLVVAELLRSAPETTSLDLLQYDLGVSKASARRDLSGCEPWLEARGLAVVRRPGVGVSVVGAESAVRHAFVQLIMEAVPEDVLWELAATPFEDAKQVRVKVAAGMRDHLARLDINSCARLLSGRPFSGALTEGSSELIMAIYLAVVAARLGEGKTIAMDTGQQRSLTDHPVAATASGIAISLAEVCGLELPAAEVAGITEYLLGLATVASPTTKPQSTHEQLLGAIIKTAADELHPALADDAELAHSVDQHLDRLSVRLRYGLPVHNPLLDEVRERYADVHTVATGLGEVIEAELGAAISEDELGFITMYLAGAIERARLRPGRRVIVICPSGMATAWVLVSRLQAEFPQLEIVSVLSARSFGEDPRSDIDFAISTVPLESDSFPVLLVNPLLTTADVDRIAAAV